MLFALSNPRIPTRMRYIPIAKRRNLGKARINIPTIIARIDTMLRIMEYAIYF